MDFNIEVRKRQLKCLGHYIKSSRLSVDSIYKTLGWNSSKTLKENDIQICCPINKNHLISNKGSTSHIEECRVRSLGYNLSDNFLSDAPGPSNSTIKLSSTAKVSVLTKARSSITTFKAAWNGHDPDPITSDRLLSTFSSDERLALYDHCVKNTQGPKVPEEFTLSLDTEKQEPKELTLEEQLMQERNAKRRSVKYKSVHTNRKNQTEIIREVIDNQMELYTEWIRQKEEVEKQKIKEAEKTNEQDIFNNLDSSQQYHYIQVHTTYGDVSIPANVLSEPLPSFNSEDNEYVDKPPSPRQHSPCSNKRSVHSSRSTERSKRTRNDDNGHFRERPRSRSGIRRNRELTDKLNKVRSRRRSNSKDKARKRSKSRYRKVEPRRSKSMEKIFREDSNERVRGGENVEVGLYQNLKTVNSPLKSPQRPGLDRPRNRSVETYQRCPTKEFVNQRRDSRSRSPQRSGSPLFQERRLRSNRTPEKYEHYEHLNQGMNFEREISPLFHHEEDIFEANREPYVWFEEDQFSYAPGRGRRESYEAERKPIFRGRGRINRKFSNFRGRGAFRGRPYFRRY